jgi:hypothetical protein
MAGSEMVGSYREAGTQEEVVQEVGSRREEEVGSRREEEVGSRREEEVGSRLAERAAAEGALRREAIACP